jgi:hypothetical protein
MTEMINASKMKIWSEKLKGRDYLKDLEADDNRMGRS